MWFFIETIKILKCTRYSRIFALSINFLLFSNISYSQKEGNIWYFGFNAGIDFNSGAPVALTNGALRSNEGTASICDEMGGLLFYTDGVWVWNRNHVRMLNGFGLLGNSSTTQSALILKKPGSATLYYIFTLDAVENNSVNGFRYSIVDMSLQGGLGDVTTKNILLYAPSTEKLTAVRHSNGCDVWVVSHEYRTNKFLTYLVDSSGVASTPVTSDIGAVHSTNIGGNGARGQLKGSPDGSKLVLTVFGLGIFEVFDFNTTTGIVSNPISFPPLTNAILELTYGVEFSPDGTKLYGTAAIFREIYQWDLLAGSPTDIINSRFLVATSNSYTMALQLAPDGKIYCARQGALSLGAINNPNELRAACNYVDNAFTLGGRQSWEGLPTFMSGYLYAKFTYENPCFGDTTFFSITDTTNIDSVQWVFGDTASGAYNTSSSLNPFHVFSAPGTYNVQMTSYSECTSVISRTVIVYPVPDINLGNDTLICPGTSLVLEVSTPGEAYLWQDNSIAPSFTVIDSGLYWVEVVNSGGCSSRDSITVDFLTTPPLDLGNDTILCEGQTLELMINIPGLTYEWQDRSTDSVFTVSQPGLYWVEVTNENGCSSSDSVVIELMHFNAEFSYEEIPCINQIQFINLSLDTTESYWDFGDGSTSNENNPIHVFSINKQYHVILIVNPGSACPDTAQASIPFDDVTMGDTLFIPNVFSPNGDGKNDYFEITGGDSPCNNSNRLMIFNRWGEKVFETEGKELKWDGTKNGASLANGTYFYILEGEKLMKSGSLSLLR